MEQQDHPGGVHASRHLPLGLSAAIFANGLLFMGIQIALFDVYAVVYGTFPWIHRRRLNQSRHKKVFQAGMGAASRYLAPSVERDFGSVYDPRVIGNCQTARPGEHSGH